MRVYEDSRGWRFAVRHGIGGDCFKVQYQKPEHRGGAVGWHGVRALPWRATEEEAQSDLDRYAVRRGMKEVLT